MRFVICLFLFLNTFSGIGVAQPYIDIASVQYATLPKNKLPHQDNHLHTSYEWMAAGLNLPLPLGQRNILLFAPSLDFRTYKIEDGDIPSGLIENNYSEKPPLLTESERSYYSFTLPLTWQHTFRDSAIKISGTFIQRYNSISTEKISGDNSQTGGAVIFNHSTSKLFTWKAGLYYNREFYGDYWLPLLGADWQINSKLRAWGLLPVSATIDYAITPYLHSGIFYSGIEDSYRDPASGSFMHPSEGHIRAFTEFYIPKSKFVFTIEAGHTALREIELFKKDHGKDTRYEVKGGSNFIFRAGIAFRFMTSDLFSSPQVHSSY